MEDKIITINTQGYFNGDVQRFADRHRPLALAVTEHKQSDLRNLKIDGYKVAGGYPATTGQRGSGLLVRDDVRYRARKDLDSYSREGSFEATSVELPDHNLVATSVYRSPRSSKTDFNRDLDRFSTRIGREPHKNHAIGGDFNIDRNRNTMTKQVLEKHGLQYNVRGATHDGGRCLDNFVTDFQPAKSRVMRNTSLSDHRPVEMHLPKSSSSRRKR